MATATETKPSSLPRLVNAYQVCEALDCSMDKLEQMYARGEFPKPFYVGRERRWRASVIEKWLSDQERLAK